PSTPTHRALHPFPTRRSSDLDDEAKAEARTYFPMPGDSEATIRQKQALRDTATSAIRRQAGRAGGDIAAPSAAPQAAAAGHPPLDRKSTRLNSSHVKISYAVF